MSATLELVILFVCCPWSNYYMYNAMHDMHVVYVYMYQVSQKNCTIFTVLHVMQTRYSVEDSVCPSVCLSVRPSVCLSHA